MAEPKDTEQEYDAKHGAPNGGTPSVPADEQWGEKLNPVRETPVAAKNLSQAGK